MNFPRIVLLNFLHCVTSPSIHNISTTIAPNHARSGPIETRNLDLSKDTKCEEIQAHEGLHKVA